MEILTEDVLRILDRVKRSGKNRWMAACPVHDDRKASFSITDSCGKALYHCFAGCSQELVTEEIKRRLGPDYQRSWERRPSFPAPSPRSSNSQPPLVEAVVEPVTEPSPGAGQFSVTAEHVAGLEELLWAEDDADGSPVWEFLTGSGVSRETVRQLHLGYNPNKYFRCGSRCPRCGSRPALVIPQFWEGELVGVKFRSLAADADDEHKWTQATGSKSDFLYLADLEPVDLHSRVVGVFEGIRDTALARSLGFNAVGMISASSVPENPSPRFLSSVEKIKENYDHVALIGDGDEAGDDAKERLWKQIGRGAVTCVVKYEPYKDLSERYAAEGEAKTREYLHRQYGMVEECPPIFRGTPAERLEATLKKALCLVKDGAEPRMVASGLRAELRVVEESDGFPPPLGANAFQGIFGTLVKEGLPCTEADEACLLYQSLTALGNLLGRSQHANFGTDRHFGNLFTLIIGKTNAGKGQGLSQVRHLIREVDRQWAEKRCCYSAASGEGLVRLVSESEREGDGRVCLIMPEMSVLLNSMNREGSNTSGYLRLGYDGLPLENQRSNKGEAAKNYLLSVLGHITPEELAETLHSVDWANGVANRFLWAAVRPSKVLTRMTSKPDFSRIQEQLQHFVSLPPAESVGFSVAGGRRWDEWVHSLPELEGKVELSQSRIRPNALRVALIFAAYDESRLEHGRHSARNDISGSTRPDLFGTGPYITIEPRHVEAAIEIVTRSRQTVEWYLRRIADKAGVSSEDVSKTRTEANKHGGRLTGTELYKLFSHKTAEQRTEIASRAGLKLRMGQPSEKGGKPPEVWTF